MNYTYDYEGCHYQSSERSTRSHFDDKAMSKATVLPASLSKALFGGLDYEETPGINIYGLGYVHVNPLV